MTPTRLAEKRDAQRFKRAGGRVLYTPLDEILQRPLIRLLRALRRFDWVEVSELFLAIGVDEDGHSAERSALAKALSRAVSTRFVERMEAREFIKTSSRRGGRDRNWYRITAAGRAELQRRLTVDMEIAEDDADEAAA